MLAVSFFDHLETELAARALQLLKCSGVDAIGSLKRQRIDAGATAQIRPLFSGLIPGSKSCGGGDKCHSTLGCIQISRRPGSPKIFTGARCAKTRLIEMADVCQDTAFAVVEGVIVGAADE